MNLAQALTVFAYIAAVAIIYIVLIDKKDLP